MVERGYSPLVSACAVSISSPLHLSFRALYERPSALAHAVTSVLLSFRNQYVTHTLVMLLTSPPYSLLIPQTPFVPNSLGQLHTPAQLYDPRVPELVALLDPDACFPAAAFCTTPLLSAAASDKAAPVLPADAADAADAGVVDGFTSLAALQQLGLRSSADLGTLLLAARYVEKTAREGDEDMAVARGKVRKSFLGWVRNAKAE
jgi:hypothetical protein